MGGMGQGSTIGVLAPLGEHDAGCCVGLGGFGVCGCVFPEKDL